MLVKPFDPTLDTFLVTDASRLYGLGYALLQRHTDNSQRLIKCGSCSLTSTQNNYATIELECLAIVWAVTKCKYYLHGLQHFTVVTDHKPLVGIFNSSLDNLSNPRLLRMREKLTDYVFTTTWVAGKTHEIADALSRYPIFQGEELNDRTVAQPIDGAVILAFSAPDHLTNLVDFIDDDYKTLRRAISSGHKPASPKPHISNLMWPNLSISPHGDGLIIAEGTRIVLPSKAIQPVLQLLHEPHQGQTKTLKLAEQLYYWHGMANDIKQITDKCDPCQKYRSSNPNTKTITDTTMEAPLFSVGTDIFHVNGQNWLVMVDRSTGFPFAAKLSSLNTTAVTNQLQTWFRDLGYPKIIRSDNGPQFRADFSTFCSSKNIKHETSSPYNPQSNGLAESAVKSIKHLLLKCSETKQDFGEAIHAWRNVPRADGYSPAMLLFGKRQYTKLPTLPFQHMLIDRQEALTKKSEHLQKTFDYFNNRAVHRTELALGDKVIVQDPISKLWVTKGEISQLVDDGLSYLILTDDGQELRRGLKLVRKLESPRFSPSSLQQSEEETEAGQTDTTHSFVPLARPSSATEEQVQKGNQTHQTSHSPKTSRPVRKKFANVRFRDYV